MALLMTILDAHAVDLVNMTSETGLQSSPPDEEPTAPEGGAQQQPQLAAPDGGEEPAAPDGGEEPAAPDGGEEPAAPDGGEEPAAPECNLPEVLNPDTNQCEAPQESDEEGGAAPDENAAALLVRTAIQNNCEPKHMCENLKLSDLFETEITTKNKGSSETLGVFPASEEGTQVELLADPNITKEYLVRQIGHNQNPSLQPWFVQDLIYSNDCSSPVESGVEKTCTITNKLASKNSTAAHLSVVNLISNDCEPERICSSIRVDELFSNHLFTFQSDEGIPYKEELTFRGSENGWMTNLFPGSNQIPVQYDVKQTLEATKGVVPELMPWKVSYSEGCHGRVVGGEINVCTITNTFSEGKQSTSKLKVITKTHNITNGCLPTQVSCLDFQSDEFFSTNVYTLKNNIYGKALVVPASKSGWTVDLLPDSNKDTVQYNVKQVMTPKIYKLLAEDTIPQVKYSEGCEGTIGRGESAVCTINNYLVKS
jgi:hypothetical protein